jgi:hypothetical protein
MDGAVVFACERVPCRKIEEEPASGFQDAVKFVEGCGLIDGLVVEDIEADDRVALFCCHGHGRDAAFRDRVEAAVLGESDGIG